MPSRQAHAAEPGDAAQQRQIEANDPAQVCRVRNKSVESVVHRVGMRPRPVIPVRPVDDPVATHPQTVSPNRVDLDKPVTGGTRV
jgi:hypothetical protein